MVSDFFINEIKNISPDELQRRGVIELAKDKKTNKCPFCGKGEGGDGLHYKNYGWGYTHTCFGDCGRSYDNFDLLAKYYGLDRSTDFVELCKRAAADFGLSADISDFENYHNLTPTKLNEKKGIEKKNSEVKELDLKRLSLIQSDIATAREHLEELPENQRRGLTIDTLKFFGCGFLSQWKYTTSRLDNKFATLTSRLIIPSGDSCYLARLTVPLETYKPKEQKYISPKPHEGKLATFGLQTLGNKEKVVFVFEGEIDAMSSWQVWQKFRQYISSESAGFIATLSAGNNFWYADLEKFFGGADEKPFILYVADNDKAGKAAAERHRAELLKRGFPTFVNFFSDGDKKIDANDVLTGKSGLSFINSNDEVVTDGELVLAHFLRTFYFQAEENLAEVQTEIEDIKKKNLEVEESELKSLFGSNVEEYSKDEFSAFVTQNLQFNDRKTGFSNIDAEQFSFQPGVYVLGGLPAVGKTTFALQLLNQLASKGETCIFGSCEMEKGLLFSKVLAQEIFLIESGGWNEKFQNFNHKVEKPLTANQIKVGKFGNHFDNFEKGMKKFAGKKLYLWEIKKKKFEDILESIRKACALLEKPPIVCIDYLQLLGTGSDNIKSALDSALQEIFNFRRETNTTFILISSLNRLNYNNSISFEAFKETGGIEYSADVIWGMQFYFEKETDHTSKNIQASKEKNPREVEIRCLKNRFGSNYNVGFYYYPAAEIFVPMLEYGNSTDITPKTSTPAYDEDDDEFRR